MPVEISTEVHRSELAEVVQSVFFTMMGLETEELVLPWTSGHERLTSAVHLAGDWCGAVLLECDRSQACQFARRFLSEPETPAGVNDVVRDVLGELANMIGGNLKCVLARGTKLSMPSVVDGDYSLRVCGAVVRDRLAFRCDEGTFWIVVLTMRS